MEINQEYFALLRQLHHLFETGFAGMYCGLYKIKVANGEDPEGCFRVQGARKAFLQMGDAEELQTIITKLHGLAPCLEGKDEYKEVFGNG